MDHPSFSDRVRHLSMSLRVAAILVLVFSAFGPAYATTVYADKLVCGIPGKDGPASLSGVVNTYYPGTADVSAGSNSIPVGGPSGAGTAIQLGDLLLVIQMQGADINSTNTGAYGNGTAGDPATGNLASNLSAGQYEYVVATSAVVSGSVSISSNLVNNYFAQDFPVGAGNQGQRRFQVIRVPQYSTATVTGTVTSFPWNGDVGGVVALDIAGTLNLNGNSVNVSGQGFRGGGGVRYTGDSTLGLASTDYRTLSTITVNASKGEGIAGTPRFVFNGSGVVDLGSEGYPNGSFSRGAPGNAGGGGTDGVPTTNEDNTGGGGGGNGGVGGLGGFGWRSVNDGGGFGGSAFPATASRLVLGGGGGAGTINNNDPVISSGGAGGGIVLVRAGTVTGSGSINANGANGQNQLLNDSGGGGGAGGSVLVVAQNSLPGGLNVSADGGDGGDAWPGMSNSLLPYPAWRHGPGAGGGGGVVFLNSAAGQLSVAGGQNGITTTDNDPYGSTPGLPGIVGTTTTAPNVTTGISGAECIPHPTIVKTTSTPVVTQTLTGTVGEYTIVVSIPANEGTALGFTIGDSLPTGFTYNSTTAINLTGGATRTSVTNPSSGTSTPSWGTFDIPGGGQVQITFAVNIASSVPAGVYQNPATATYTDPTRTVSNGTTTTNYDSGSSTGEDIEVISPALPDLIVLKTNNVNGNVAQNSPFSWTLTVTNNGIGSAAFASGQTILSDALPGAAGYYPQGVLTVTNGGVTPQGTIDCTISGTTLSCDANGIVSLSTGSSFSVTFTVTPSAAGDLANTVVVDPDGIMPEGNENNNESLNIVSVLGADLSIVKNDGQTSYLAGSVVSYTVTVTNNNGVTATGSTVTDTRPANISTWSWACTGQTGGAAGCTPAANSASNFTDTVDLPVNGTIVYTVTANVVANPTGDLVNTATVSIPTGFSDPNPNNNTSSDTDTLTATSADLSVVKDDGQTGYSGGSTVTYIVTVSNLSGVDITNAVVSDPIPANISTWAWACINQTNGATGCTAAGSSSTDFSDTVNLPVGGSVVYSVTANVVANPTGDLVNTATITPPTGFADSDISNNSSTDTDILFAADLSITKNDGQVTYSGGAVVTYTVTVTNLNGVAVTGAVINDPKPANISTWAWACTTQGGGASGCDPAADSLADFSDTINLPVGGTVVYTVTANILANPTGNLVNTATVTLPNGYSDLDNSNNTSTDTDVLGQAADLFLTKTASTSTATVQSTINFTLSVTNLGPDDTSGVEMTDQLPSGYSFVSSSASQGSYNNATGVWTIGDMAVNDTATLTLTVTVNASGSHTNTAEITASLLVDPDSTPNNNNPQEDDQDIVTVNVSGGVNPTPTPRPGGNFLIPVTGFKADVVTDMSNVPHEKYMATGNVMLEIPSLGVKLPIVGVPRKNGAWNVSWLENQAGWLEGSAFPSWSGNSILTSHVYLASGLPGPFVSLNKLKFGDKIIVHAYGQKYTFEVQTNTIVEPTDQSVMKHEEKSWLTLVTCRDYDEKTQTYKKRVVVRAILVRVDWE